MLKLLFIFLIGAEALSWLHITDIHVDMKYKVGAPSECLIGTKLGTRCCREMDIPLKGTEPCGKYGNFQNDVPPYLVDSIFNWIQKNLKFDFIVNTGDDGSHKDINQVFTQDNLESINFVSEVLDKYWPTIPSYRVVGNHDAFPNVDQTFPGYENFLEETTKSWRKWIPDDNVSKYGYYSVDYNANIKIVVLNSLWYDTNNIFGINSSTSDVRTGCQFDWLKGQFENAVENGQKIMFLNHIPIMGGESNIYTNENMIPILKKYTEHFLVIMNGHSHRNRFLLYQAQNQYIGYAMITGSIFTDNKYPTFRVYKYSNSVLDYDEYVCNIDMAEQTNNFECTFSYSFLKEYGVSNIDLHGMVDLYRRMKSNKTLLEIYKKHYSPPTVDEKEDYLGEILNVY
jgi:hypothetical protein